VLLRVDDRLEEHIYIAMRVAIAMPAKSFASHRRSRFAVQHVGGNVDERARGRVRAGLMNPGIPTT
jgi:hypothetical protein